MPEIDAQSVQAALANVTHPDFGKPLSTLQLVRDVAVSKGRVSLTVICNAPVDSLQRTIQEEIERALSPLGVSEVHVTWDLQVPMRPTSAEDPVPGVRNVVLVMSGKGGVGKSTCAANLTLALSRAGARVGLLDADIYGPSIPTMLGVEGHPRANQDKKIIPLERFGIKIMSIGFMIESDRDAIIWRGPMVQGALLQFLGDVAWGELDYLIVDLPPGTGDVALSLGQKLKTTGAVMVTTPQEVALQDVYKGVSMCQKLQIPILGVIENMSYFVDPAGVRHELFGSGGGQKVAEYADAPLLGQVPVEPAVRQCGDDGTPIVQADPKAASAQVFTAITDALTRGIARTAFERTGGDRAPDTKAQRRLKILR
ncbi:MAG: Mrp/NBP35 family ATP-binding protein [Myxococcales bacterium]|nr:Mrp/NBP35 family ATP-binding protein [Myxococcales bacterium]